MPMSKANRKTGYSEVIGLMLKQNHKEAFDKLTLMCGTDTGLFIMADYDKTLAKMAESKAERLAEEKLVTNGALT
ncbi:hypothetical protein GD1_96 [Paraglaciecola Antarctic GD virus 1]|nr:hypothetical protein GD1_96 [Paraglaciecola Antarctic GD virus 1]